MLAITRLKGPVISLALFAVSALTALAYQQAQGMKSVWGEKVTPENAWREYPRPQMVREKWSNLNGEWDYAVTSVTNTPGIPELWDGRILVPFVIESALSGVKRDLQPDETLWYRRGFMASVKAGERLLLHFEQVDFRTMVFVNRVEVGVPHEGGQMPFTYDITDYVRDGENELVLSVWDPTANTIGSHGKQALKPFGCMYTRSSGVSGTVWTETVPETHISGYRVTTDVDAGTVSVILSGVGDISSAEGTVLVSRNGRTLAQGRMGKWGEPVVIALPKPIALWSPESPELYDLTLTFGSRKGGAADVAKGYFGMRKFEMRKDDKGILRFYLNGTMRFPIGTLDQGWWPDGVLTPPSEEAMKFDIVELKKLGFDMLRKHIKVEPRRYYYLCDKLGMLLFQDMPSGLENVEQRYGFYRRELKELIDHLYNVPSIVMWVPYNEGWGQPGQFLTHSTLMWTQRYDPTRLVDGPSGWFDWEGGLIKIKKDVYTEHLPLEKEEAAHVVDMHDYKSRPEMFPVNERRASILGEFGGIGCRVHGHCWHEYPGANPKDCDPEVALQKYVAQMEYVGELAAKGLAASVYTQTSDVVHELNGFFTYDRKVVKFRAEPIVAVHDKVRRMARSGDSRPDAVK